LPFSAVDDLQAFSLSSDAASAEACDVTDEEARQLMPEGLPPLVFCWTSAQNISRFTESSRPLHLLHTTLPTVAPHVLLFFASYCWSSVLASSAAPLRAVSRRSLRGALRMFAFLFLIVGALFSSMAACDFLRTLRCNLFAVAAAVPPLLPLNEHSQTLKDTIAMRLLAAAVEGLRARAPAALAERLLATSFGIQWFELTADSSADTLMVRLSSVYESVARFGGTLVALLYLLHAWSATTAWRRWAKRCAAGNTHTATPSGGAQNWLHFDSCRHYDFRTPAPSSPSQAVLSPSGSVRFSSSRGVAGVSVLVRWSAHSLLFSVLIACLSLCALINLLSAHLPSVFFAYFTLLQSVYLICELSAAVALHVLCAPAAFVDLVKRVSAGDAAPAA
jgi:hypothetical protein